MEVEAQIEAERRDSGKQFDWERQSAIKAPWPRRFPAARPRRTMQFGTGRSSG
jgi:hypothetical protein